MSPLCTSTKAQKQCQVQTLQIIEAMVAKRSDARQGPVPQPFMSALLVASVGKVIPAALLQDWHNSNQDPHQGGNVEGHGGTGFCSSVRAGDSKASTLSLHHTCLVEWFHPT